VTHAIKTNRSFAFRRLARRRRLIFPSLALVIAVTPALLLAQYSETKMGEYLHYAVAAANGGIYAGYDGIGYATPSLYKPNTGWVDLPFSLGFNTSLPYYGYSTSISHDGSIVAGYTAGVTTNGVSKQFAAYWVNGVESIVPAPPDDPGATAMSATGISGDGTTLLVQDMTPDTVESYVFNIASKTFTSLGFLGSATLQTYATAISSNGTVVAGYSDLDNGNIDGFIWDASNGLRDLGIPASHPNTAYLEPTCISDDGTTLFGQLTEFNGWVGFRYNSTTGFQDIGDISPSACTADGTETVGIENMYFPAVWSAANGGGYLDHLVTATVTTQGLGTVKGPVTISPDGSAITALGPDAYPVDQVWYGTWQVTLPSPLKIGPIAPNLNFSTAYATTLTVPPGTLIQYAEFNTGDSAVTNRGPRHASSFVLHPDGSFTYTPRAGYSNQTDRFSYQLVSPSGTGNVAQVQIYVAAPAAPTITTPTAINLTSTSATLGGNVTSDGGAPIKAIGVVYAPTALDSNPQIGDLGVTAISGTGTTGVFTVDVTGLTPGTDYSFAAYASNNVGISYSEIGSFTTPATYQSWQQTWFGDPGSSDAVYNADSYHTGVPNLEVFAFFGPYQDPSSASIAQLPQVQMSDGNLFFNFSEPADISSITYGAQWSTTLQANDWHAIPDTGDSSATPPQHLFSVPIGTNTQLFLRLSVTGQ